MRGDKRDRASSAGGRALPLIAGLIILVWTIYFFTVRSDAVDRGVPLTELIGQWAVPVLLVLAAWLLALRYASGSHVAAPSGSGNLAALEQKLAAIDRKLDGMPATFPPAGQLAARPLALRHDPSASPDPLGDGSPEIAALVESRFETLRVHADRFRVELESREQDGLSAIRRRADELAKAISAQDIALRRDAGQAMDELQARFKAMRDENLRLSGELEKVQADSLRSWDRAVNELEGRMRATVGKVVEVDQQAIDNSAARLATLHAEAERIDALAAERMREFDAQIAQRRDLSLAHGTPALAKLEDEIADFDQRIDERREVQLARIAELGERSEALAGRMAEIDGTLAGHLEQFEAASAALAGFTGELSGRFSESQALLENSSRLVGELTGASTRMFEQIRASADFSSNTIPGALSAAHDRLATFEERAHALRDAIGEIEVKSAALAGNLDRAREGVPITTETLDAIGTRLTELATQSDALARKTREELSHALGELENSTTSIAARLREGQELALDEFAATFGARSIEAIGTGLREQTEAAIAQLQQTSQDAGRAGLETVSQLRSQLAQVEEMAGNLETRVNQARDKAQDEPNKDFSIEMTKITERLNGAAIDIVKVFDADVSDLAWQAYMRGDYGTFTRKAVRLLPTQKADAVLGFYQSDKTFRETVNRYVGDFESMLRVILTTRNGHQMAVTLLSSDVGKLYVALAQATERLRD